MSKLPQSKYDEYGRPIKKSLLGFLSSIELVESNEQSSHYKSHNYNKNKSCNNFQEHRKISQFKETIKQKFDNIDKKYEANKNNNSNIYNNNQSQYQDFDPEKFKEEILPVLLAVLSFFIPGIGFILALIVLFVYSESKLNRKLKKFELLGRKIAYISILYSLILLGFYLMVSFM